VTRLVQSVGHVDSLVVLLPVSLLVFQVESVFDWSDEVEGDFEVFVEVVLFLNGRDDYYKESFFADSVIRTNHHNVDVILSLGLVLRENDLNCTARANSFDWLINNTNGSS
jgi:hypothetical protein